MANQAPCKGQTVAKQGSIIGRSCKMCLHLCVPPSSDTDAFLASVHSALPDSAIQSRCLLCESARCTDASGQGEEHGGWDRHGEGLTIDVVAHTMGLEGCTCLLHVRNVACVICWDIPGVSHKHIVAVTEAESIWCEILCVLRVGGKGSAHGAVADSESCQ